MTYARTKLALSIANIVMIKSFDGEYGDEFKAQLDLCRNHLDKAIEILNKREPPMHGVSDRIKRVYRRTSA